MLNDDFPARTEDDKETEINSIVGSAMLAVCCFLTGNLVLRNEILNLLSVILKPTLMNSKNYRFLFSIMLCFIVGMNSQVVYGKSTSFICIEPVTDTTKEVCSDSIAIEKIITDAIELGAPIYNAGLYIGCYRIYEWAAYKILYVYGSNCKDVEKILKSAVEKSHGDYSDTEKAWLMRVAFDKILGVPTKTGNPEKVAPERENLRKG